MENLPDCVEVDISTMELGRVDQVGCPWFPPGAYHPDQRRSPHRCNHHPRALKRNSR
jgi:hypothetical protein